MSATSISNFHLVLLRLQTTPLTTCHPNPNIPKHNRLMKQLALYYLRIPCTRPRWG